MSLYEYKLVHGKPIIGEVVTDVDASSDALYLESNVMMEVALRKTINNNAVLSQQTHISAAELVNYYLEVTGKVNQLVTDYEQVKNGVREFLEFVAEFSQDAQVDEDVYPLDEFGTEAIVFQCVVKEVWFDEAVPKGDLQPINICVEVIARKPYVLTTPIGLEDRITREAKVLPKLIKLKGYQGAAIATIEAATEALSQGNKWYDCKADKVIPTMDNSISKAIYNWLDDQAGNLLPGEHFIEQPHMSIGISIITTV